MKLSEMSNRQILDAVANKYGQVAKDPSQTFEFPTGREFARAVGYPSSLLNRLPEQSVDAFAGISSTILIADIAPGHRVLDLGCGAGMDAIIAGHKVGVAGYVEAIDASQDMIDVAEQGRVLNQAENVHFTCCFAEHLPFPDNYFDAIVSNGIFNLAPDEAAVAKEAYRVLKPGGKFTFSEIVLRELPDSTEIDDELSSWFKCIGGARLEVDLLAMFSSTGFQDIQILRRDRNARTRNPHTYYITAVMQR